LIGLMDANPKAGIIQTVPYPVGRETFFARMQQFSARLYGPLLVEGLTFWQQSDGNYWGHNAIVRIAPFMAHCELPVLPGREPWGGEILCHDVVEAGLMRAAGWDVWVLPQGLESYEAVPANAVDFASRERRWCQGNLQHSGVIGMAGLRPVGRFHLGYGIAHYLAAPTAMLFMVLATVDGLLGGGFARGLFSGGAASAGFIALGAVLLYAGKLTSLVAVLVDGAEARQYGGRLALLASAVLEQLSACVMSAMLIVLYTRFVFELLRGRTVRWDAQARDDRGVGWSEGWSRMRLPTLAGLVWLVCLPLMPHGTRGFMLPLLLGLLACWPVAIVSSRVSLGRWARRTRLLLTPEEVNPPAILRAYQRALLRPLHPDRAAIVNAMIHLEPQGETP
jgi:membrane glycosyltransferase